jgi:O-antigen/teichoic acid export membrane protein
MFRRLLKGGAWLAVGNAVSSLASFLRNIVIARLVSVEDFGVVVLLALTLSALETVSNLAVDRLLVQAPDGDDPRLQDAAHFLQMVRGVLGGLIVLCVASLLASLFQVPHATWAFQVLSLAPVIRGFAHLDNIRLQREMRFQPTFWVTALPALVSLLSAIPFAYYLHDYSAIVWATLLQILAQTGISHFQAVRPYRWALDRLQMARILRFGWPLLANGLLMFVIFQGDKAIVAVAFSPEVVGWYGAAFMLSMAPAMLITSVANGLLLPVLSRVQAVPDEFARRYRQTIQISLWAGLVVSSLIAVFGPELLVALFGTAYRAGGGAAIVLGVAQGVRIAKGGQFVCAIAMGKTKDPLIGNLGRGAGFFVAILCVAVGFDTLSVAIVGLLSEVLSYLIAVRLLVRRGYPTDHGHFVEGLVFVCLTSLAVFVGEMLRQHFSLLSQLALGVLFLLILAGSFATLLPSLRELIVMPIKARHGQEK